MRRRERCAICKKKISRQQFDNSARFWFGPANHTGEAQLLAAHQECGKEITEDMHASPREAALLIANQLHRARQDRSEDAEAALVILSIGLGGSEHHDELYEQFTEWRNMPEDEFIEQVNELLREAGYTVGERASDGSIIVQRVQESGG